MVCFGSDALEEALDEHLLLSVFVGVIGTCYRSMHQFRPTN